MSPDESKRAIELIKKYTTKDAATTAAISLLNIIPYAGGAIASVISEYASFSRTAKICDVLSDLNNRLESHEAKPEINLSKDQIVELVYHTLGHSMVESDQEKLNAFKNGLAYSMIQPGNFEYKQLYLYSLRNCSSLELAILKIIYLEPDPFTVYEGIPDEEKGSILSPIYGQEGQWIPIANRDNDLHTLGMYISTKLNLKSGFMTSICSLLDGKGLSSLSENLQLRRCIIFNWERGRNLAINISYGMTGRNIEPSPIEISKTEYGKNFIEYCTFS